MVRRGMMKKLKLKKVACKPCCVLIFIKMIKCFQKGCDVIIFCGVFCMFVALFDIFVAV